MKTAIGVALTTDENWDEFSDYVLEAERMGVDSVWSAEAWGHDGATPLAYLAAKTSRIKLGSGILRHGDVIDRLCESTSEVSEVDYQI